MATLSQEVLSRISDFEWLAERAAQFKELDTSTTILQQFTAAADALQNIYCNDREVLVYRNLAAHSILPTEIPKGGPCCLASLLCTTLLATPPRGGRYPDPEDDIDAGRKLTIRAQSNDMVNIPRSEILLWIASQLLQANIFLFSSRN